MKKWTAIRKLLAAWVLCISMFAPFLSHIHFTISRAIHRHEMWEMAERKNFETITLKNNDLVWIKKGKEILINGSYFDVKQIVFEDDMAIVTGIFDHEEKALAERFEREQDSDHNELPAGIKLKTWWQLTCTHSMNDDNTSGSFFLKFDYPIQPVPEPCGQRERPISPPPNNA